MWQVFNIISEGEKAYFLPRNKKVPCVKFEGFK
jgi:hypothetical protein